MAVDFIPELKGYSGQGSFRFWCQTVLPLVYDDSLSYYELLCKVVEYLNNCIADVANVEDNVTALSNAFAQLQEWVVTYFDELDLQPLIDEKLDEMASTGALTELIAPFIPDIVTAWLNDHVSPTAPVIDNSLLIEGAGADAKKTGRLFYNGIMDETIRAIMSPKVISFYSVPADQTLNLLEMPTESKAYKSWSNISGTPVDYDGSSQGAWFVVRTGINISGYVSLYILYAANTHTFIFGRRISEEPDAQIEWGEPFSLDAKVLTDYKTNYEPNSINNFVDTGFYWCEIVDGNKTITDFPYRTGYLFVLRLNASHVYQFCIENGSYVKGEGFPVPFVRYYNGTEWIETKFGYLETTPVVKLNLDSKKEDWLLTNFNQIAEWWQADGTLTSGSQNTHSELIPVEGGQKLYGMYFGGTTSQSIGGAFFDENKQWIAPVAFPYSTYSHPYVEEYVYPKADVVTDDFTYTKMYVITVPTNARFISINFRYRNAFLGTVQSLSTLPIIGRSNTGNYIWRRDDPLRQKKKGKKLCIIGQSGVGYDRASQNQYDAKTQETAVAHPSVGLQEYIIPYYDVDQNGVSSVTSLGFSGIGYRWDGTSESVYKYLTDNDPQYDYTGKENEPLKYADEVLILAGTNNLNTLAQLGSYKSTDVSTLMGALNGIIDYIYSVSDTGRVQIYIETFVNKYKNGATPASGMLYENYNYQLRMLAKNRGLILIDRAQTSGLNANNFMYFSADADVHSPYGTHMNDYGNMLRGRTYLNGLLYGDNSVGDNSAFTITQYDTLTSLSLLSMASGESAYISKANIVEFQTGGAFTDCTIAWSGYVYVEKIEFYPNTSNTSEQAAAIYKFTTSSKVFQCWRAGSPRTNTWLLIAGS